MDLEQVDLNRLLADASWLRRLAESLAHGDGEAEDLVQDTWLAAFRSPPDPGRPARPWLGQVLRNYARMAWRSAARRTMARGVDVEGVKDPADAPDRQLETIELHRIILTFVGELDEPYRTSIMLRFYEGLPTATIATRLGIPPGTARWRLSEGVRRLRARLDTAEPGAPRRWRGLVLLPARAVEPRRWRVAPLLAVASSSAVVIVALGWLLPTPASLGASAGSTPGASGPGTGAASAPGRGGRGTNVGAGERLGQLARVAVPALLAAASDSKPFTRDEMIDECVWHNERAAECTDTLVESTVALWTRRLVNGSGPPGPTEEATEEFRRRQRALILAFRNASPEERRETCAAQVDGVLRAGKAPPVSRSQDARWHACFDQNDCVAARPCIDGVFMFPPSARR
jgi:RNA polymerase sigma factor (sigma-70 family)